MPDRIYFQQGSFKISLSEEYECEKDIFIR